MKKVLFLGLVLASIAWGASRMIPPSTPALVNAQGFAQTTPVPAVSTPTLLPTIDYAASLQVAENEKNIAVATANEAGRINAQATAEHEQRLIDAGMLTLANNGLTATSDAIQLVRESWTVTAYPTSVYLTTTQQVVDNTQVAAEKTATEQYPNQVISALRAENEKKCGMTCYLIDYFAKCALGMFCIGMILYLFVRVRMDVDKEARKQAQEDADLTPKLYPVKDQPGNYKRKKVVPCTEDQLSELAELVVNGERTLGINRLEQESRTFRSKREELTAVRNFLVRKDVTLAFHPKQTKGDIVVNEAGIEFFTNWFETHELPEGFYFADGEELEETIDESEEE